MPYTLNTTSECTSENLDQNRRFYPEHLSVGISKDLDYSFDNEISSAPGEDRWAYTPSTLYPLESRGRGGYIDFHLQALENGREALENNQIIMDEKRQMEADVTAEEEMFNGSDLPPVVDARSSIVAGNAGIDKFENEELSSTFENKDRTCAFTTDATIVGIDDVEVSFRFLTFESSLLATEELEILHKEPAAIFECFEDIESGGDLQTSSPEVHKDESHGNYCSFSSSNILVSVGNSVLAGGIENGIMQDNQKYIDLLANDEENEKLESINNDSSGTQYVQLLSGHSSPELGGKISAESDLDIEFGEYSSESKPQDSLNDACEEESPKSVGGFQDSDLAQSKSTESELYVRSLDIPPQSNMLDGYQGNQVIENYSRNASIIEDSIVCSGVNQSVSSDGTDMLFTSVVDDIPK